jgi:hypothetical protein
MKVGPSQRIMAKQSAKARTDRARDAMRGSPSPWRVFARTAKAAAETVESVSVSERESEVIMVVVMMGGFWRCSSLR